MNLSFYMLFMDDHLYICILSYKVFISIFFIRLNNRKKHLPCFLRLFSLPIIMIVRCQFHIDVFNTLWKRHIISDGHGSTRIYNG